MRSIAVLLCLTLSLPCAAWSLRTDSQGDIVRWTQPVEMVLDPQVGTPLGAAGAEDAIRAALAFAADPPALTRAEAVALVEVTSEHASQHPKNPGLLITELTIVTRECLKGDCAGLDRVVVGGGTLGDVEQVVVHEPIPAAGQRVLVTRTGGKTRVVWVEPALQATIIERLRAAAAGRATPAAQEAPVLSQ